MHWLEQGFPQDFFARSHKLKLPDFLRNCQILIFFAKIAKKCAPAVAKRLMAAGGAGGRSPPAIFFYLFTPVGAFLGPYQLNTAFYILWRILTIGLTYLTFT